MYISFEGPIAAGKTTMAKRLYEHLGKDALLLLEQFEDNPFLALFYNDRARWSLAMQLDFLIKRHRQLGCESLAKAPHVVADHSMIKDSVFANLLLTGDELELYQSISNDLPSQAVRPELFVYLDAPNDILLERIRDRGRPYERSISSAYLDSLRAEYEKNIPTMGAVIYLDTTTFSPSSSADLDSIWRTIRSGVDQAPCRTREADNGN